MRDFLQKHGVIGVTAQKLLEEFGSLTEERVRQDPYTALTKTSQGSTYRCALHGLTSDLLQRSCLADYCKHSQCQLGYPLRLRKHCEAESGDLMFKPVNAKHNGVTMFRTGADLWYCTHNTVPSLQSPLVCEDHAWPVCLFLNILMHLLSQPSHRQVSGVPCTALLCCSPDLCTAVLHTSLMHCCTADLVSAN